MYDLSKTTIHQPKTHSELLTELAEQYGFNDTQDFLEEYVIGSVCPGICPKCLYTVEVEPDCEYGYCEGCNDQTVISGLILAEII